MKKERISLRLIIIALFTLLMTTTFALTTSFIFSNWRLSAQTLVTENQSTINTAILQKIENLLDTPVAMNQTHRHILENNLVNFADKQSRDIFFAGIMKNSDEEVYSFTYGNEKGEYYGARRNQKDTIEIVENNAATNGRSYYYAINSNLTAGTLIQKTPPFDPRTRDWYTLAKETGQSVFSPIYRHFVMDDLVISAAQPIYNQQGLFQGVLGAHITLSKMNGFLEEAVTDKFINAYIVEKQTGYLVANSLQKPNFEAASKSNLHRIALEELNQPALTQAWEDFKATGKTLHSIPTAKDQLHITFTEIHRPGLDWLIITVIPELPFTSGILESIRFSIFLSLVALILAIFLYMKGTDYILKPVYHLIKTTEQFSKGNFQERATIFRNDEIGNLAVAFNKMADQLSNLVDDLESRIKERTKRLEATILELKESRERYEALITQSSEAVVVADLETRQILEVNETFLTLFGYSRLEMQDLLTNGSLPVNLQRIDEIAAALLAGHPSPTITDSYQPKEGTPILLEGIGSLINHNGRLLLLLSYRDVTLQKQAEKEKEENQKRLAILERMASLGTLAAGVAHEMNQPLQALKVTLDAMIYWHGKGKSPDIPTLIENCQKSSGYADRISRIVKRLQDFVNRSQTREYKEVDLNQICKQALSMLREPLKVNRVHLIERYSATPLLLWGDEARLEEIVINVAVNALQALNSVDQPEKEITITTYQNTTSTILEIFDNGPGIPEDVIDKIFNPFFTTQTTSENMGLGLSIVHSIVEAHQGRIQILTMPKGVCFQFHFPIPQEVTDF